MAICKLSFAKSRSVEDPDRGTGASEVLRNEAYIKVRRSASGPEGLRPGGTRDEGNAADGHFPSASQDARRGASGRAAVSSRSRRKASLKPKGFATRRLGNFSRLLL